MAYTQSMDAKEFFWVAGFLEGEGSFTCSQVNKRSNGYSFRPRITVGQKDREPLDRLAKAIGGKIYYSPAQSRTNPIYGWQVGGSKAISLMMMFWTALSSRRREQIEKAISVWKSSNSKPGRRAKCIMTP